MVNVPLMNQEKSKYGIVCYATHMNGKLPYQLKAIIVLIGFVEIFRWIDYPTLDAVNYVGMTFGAALIVFPFIQHKLFVSRHLAFNEHGIFGKTGLWHWINMPWEDIEEIRREAGVILIVTNKNTEKFSTKWMSYSDRVNQLPNLEDIAKSHNVDIVNLIRTAKTSSPFKRSDDTQTIGLKPAKFDIVRIAFFILGLLFLIYAMEFSLYNTMIISLISFLPSVVLLSLVIIYPSFLQPDYLEFDKSGITGKVGLNKNLNKTWDKINKIEHQPPHITFRLESGEVIQINYHWFTNPTKIVGRYKDFLPELERIAELNNTPFIEKFDYKPGVVYGS